MKSSEFSKMLLMTAFTMVMISVTSSRYKYVSYFVTEAVADAVSGPSQPIHTGSLPPWDTRYRRDVTALYSGRVATVTSL